jgi:hypothetical protein
MAKSRELADNNGVGNQWLLSVILAIWETQIKRIVVQGQPGQILNNTHRPNNQSKMD